MLAGLERVNWAELTHAYGTASDVPGQLRDLASAAPGRRQQALQHLYSNIHHQGTVYQATAAAVPFLVELLDCQSDQGKTGLLALLKDIADGSSYLYAHHRWLPQGQREAEGFRAELEQGLEWVRAAARAVANGIPSYLKLLCDGRPSVRSSAAYLLGACGRIVPDEAEAALAARLQQERNARVRAEVLLALAAIGIAHDERQARLAGLLESMAANSRPGLVKFCAALGSARCGTAEQAKAMVPLLCRHLQSCGGFQHLLAARGRSALAAACWALAARPLLRWSLLMQLQRHPDAAVRCQVIDSIGSFCRQQRPIVARAVPALLRSLVDPAAEVRERVARLLPTLGRSRLHALPALRDLAAHPDESVRALAIASLEALRKPRDRYRLSRWLSKRLAGYGVAELIAVLEGKSAAPHDHALRSLELLGAAARDAAPALRQILASTHNFWLRMYCLRALWSVTGDAAEVVPALVDSLNCSPLGLLALDCLARIGPPAAAAAPALRRIVEAKERPHVQATEDDLIDLDERFVQFARRALRRIESGHDSPA